jgi:dihydroorotate dehydrogenase (NAD+) catalytic subunit
MVGAQAVEVGTANFLDPEASIKIIRGLENFCRRKGIERLRSLVGSLVTEELGGQGLRSSSAG